MKLFEVPMVVMSLLGICLLSSVDLSPAQANFTFGTPTNLGPKVNTSAHDDCPTLPADGLSLFFSSTRLGGIPVYDLFVITRETLDGEWSASVNLGAPINTAGMDITPSISADGLTLVFASERPGGYGSLDMCMTTRQTKDDPWAVPVHLGAVVNSADSADYDWTPSLSANMLELYFSSNRAGGHGNLDLWVTTRATPQSAWGPPVNLGPIVNSPSEEYCPAICADGLCLMFSSTRPGGYGSRDVWITTRASRNDPWRTPWNPGLPLNSPAMDVPNCISPDGSTLYLSSSRSGGYGAFDLCQAPIMPIVDFNADGKVDLDDLRLLIDAWGTDNTLYDIGPFAWGDGKVDIEDLKVFVAEWEKWEKQNPPAVDDGQ